MHINRGINWFWLVSTDPHPRFQITIAAPAPIPRSQMPASADRPPPPRYASRGHCRLLIFILKCAIMLLGISLFLFFLGFAATVVIYFLIMSTAFHRRPTRKSPHLEALLHDVVYRGAASPDASDCAICLEPFRQGDHCRDVPACGHLFHADCLDRWVRTKPNCPVCRSPVQMNWVGVSRPWFGGADPWKRLWSVEFQDGDRITASASLEIST